MRVELRLGGLIQAGEAAIALGRTHALLDGIARERSVARAAARLGVSYRSAWGQLAELERALGRPVAEKTKGHGSVLTPFGEALRAALADTLAGFEAEIRERGRALEERLSALVSEAAEPRPVRLAISHDPVLLGALAEAAGFDVAVTGSAEALQRLAEGRADAAGFHDGGAPVALPESLAADPAIEARPLFTREQGFIVARGNPLGIRTVADLPRARLVNRQRGSGTRSWLDRLVAEAGVAPEAIRGYGHEEFTHQAVAALVAAGAADAGMGARSAAEGFGLGFVPVGVETYRLAGRGEVLDEVLGRAGPRLRELTRGRAGYGPAGEAQG